MLSKLIFLVYLSEGTLSFQSICQMHGQVVLIVLEKAAVTNWDLKPISYPNAAFSIPLWISLFAQQVARNLSKNASRTAECSVGPVIQNMCNLKEYSPLQFASHAESKKEAMECSFVLEMMRSGRGHTLNCTRGLSCPICCSCCCCSRNEWLMHGWLVGESKECRRKCMTSCKSRKGWWA